MKRKPMADCTVGELVDMYRQSASAQHKAGDVGDNRTANRHSDILFGVYRELRGRGQDALRGLLPLLRDEDVGVRLWAASHTLEVAPEKAEPVLVEIQARPRTAGLSATYVLKQWREGTYKIP